MTGLEIALILGAAGKAGQGIMTGASQIDRLTPEQKNRMKELERNQALGLLGLDEAQQQQILNQQLQPVQAAEREAFSRQAQQQQIADIGQGAAFRGQQALLEASAQARSQATQRAQDVITERDALEEAAQLRELAQIKAQRQQNLEGIAQIAGGVGDAALMGLGTSMAIKEAEGLEKKLLEAKEEEEKKMVEDTFKASQDYMSFLGSFAPAQVTPALGAAQTAAQMPAPPAAPVQQVASVNNPAVDAMVAEGRATPEEAARIMEILGTQVPKSNEDVIPRMWGGEYTATIERGLNGLPTKVLVQKPGGVPFVYTPADPEQWRDIMQDITQAQGL